ncbi:MAG: hypothetical protein WEB53_15040, partial [Akkermansiaceae bacterium]
YSSSIVTPSPGRKPKCTHEQLLAILPVETVKEWENQADSLYGLKRTQFNEMKRVLVEDGKAAQDEQSKQWVAI